MDDFERFWRGLEKERFFGLGERKIEKVLEKVLLQEYNLKTKTFEETEKADFLATCTDRLDKEVKTLVRVQEEIEEIDREDLEDFYADMVDVNALYGVYLTNSYYSKDAMKFAKNLPVRLIDRKELMGIVYEIEALTYEKAFISDVDDAWVSRYFKSKLGAKITNIVLRLPDRIEGIDRRYMPLGFYTLTSSRGGEKHEKKYAYIDLASGDLYYIDEGEVKKNETIKKILMLPSDTRQQLLELIEHGDLPYENVGKKSLDILRKTGMASIHERQGGGGLPAMIASEMSSFVKIGVDQMGQFGSMKESGGSPEVCRTELPAKRFAGANVKIPPFDHPYNLEHFMETAKTAEGFDSDGVKYNPEEIAELLKHITGADVKFHYIIHFPYYLAKYTGPRGTRYERVWAPRFKSFFPKPGGYNVFYHVIDKFPDLPYLILAFIHVTSNYGRDIRLFHTFASAVLYIVIALAAGIALKAIFRTERTTPFYATQDYGVAVFRYGFPSLHSLMSFGAITFVYFIEPDGLFLSFMCIPIAVIYMYSRIRIGAHSRTDVVGGMIIGLVIGFLAGDIILNGDFIPPALEMLLSILMATALIVSIIARIKYMH
ncbi:MAG: phosphatase PAP2 family protein [Candidatus Altiarchaeota archaeon]|nr:phosphatase PAP2 family protein [Candidatus Altiarchaeota archaeon]